MNMLARQEIFSIGKEENRRNSSALLRFSNEARTQKDPA